MKKTKVSDLTVEDFKEILRQLIREEIPTLITINNTYPQQKSQYDIWISTDTQSRPPKHM